MSINPIVSSHGYGSANIFFLGGHPFKDDLFNGLALTGNSETTLNQFLRPHKLNVKNTYRSVLIKEKLSYSGNNSKKLRIALGELDVKAYQALLLEELKSISPNVIVPLDDLALGAVFPHIETISKPRGRKYWVDCYRGSVLSLRADYQIHLKNQVRVIPTIAPNLMYANPAARAYVSLDYEKIVAHKEQTQPIKEYGMRWVAKDSQSFENYLTRSFAKNPEFVTFDIETYAGLITCISFCFDGYEGVSVPLYESSNKYRHQLIEKALLWRLVARVLAHPIPKVNQNIKYDLTILERHGFVVNNIRGDIMLKGHLLYPELPKGLDFYTSIYTEIPYYKDEGKEYNPRLHTRDRLYLYNAQDSIAAHVINTKQEIDIQEHPRLKALYEEEIVPLIIIYKNIDERGILVDQTRKAELLEKYETLYSNNQDILRTLVGDPTFNAKSWQQVGKLLYDELRFPRRIKTDPETGKITYRTDKETLDDLVINHALDNKQGQIGATIINRIVVLRKLAKIIEYINTPLHPDGRFHGTSNLAGTETGRSSFSKSLDEAFWFESKKNQLILDKSTKTRLGRSLQTISKHGFQVDEEIFNDWDDKVITIMCLLKETAILLKLVLWLFLQKLGIYSILLTRNLKYMLKRQPLFLGLMCLLLLKTLPLFHVWESHTMIWVSGFVTLVITIWVLIVWPK